MMKIACVGILVADTIVEPVNGFPGKGILKNVNSITMHNGGNAMTASINIKKLGVETAIIGMVGKDSYGDFLVKKLSDSNVDTAGLKVSDSAQTSTSVLMIDSTGERSFFHCKGTNAVFSESDIDYSIIDKTDIVFTTGSFLMDNFDGEGTMKFLKKCKEKGKTTFLDVCWDASGKWGSLIDMSLPYIDFFMPSIDEAKEIAKKDSVEEIADVFVSKGAKNIIIKLGSQGSYFRRAGERTGKIYPPMKVSNPVDTTGAGDSFCSGFIASYARGEELDLCMRFANTVGACCVTEKGATTGIRTYEETMKLVRGESKLC